MSFRRKIEKTSEEAESNIILALDFPHTEKHRELLTRSLRVLDTVSSSICAVKLNRQLVLPLCLFNGVQTIVDHAHEVGLVTIMDAKINDIGNTNRTIVEYYYEAGFDAVISSPFVGWEEGLEPVFEVAQRTNRGVIVLVYMSHKSATEGYGQIVQDSATKKLVPQYRLFAEKALRWNADGAVVGATYPDKIREIHAILKDRVQIYSPGVGAQGGDVEAAVEAGAHYLIVGRTIVEAKDPAKSAEDVRKTAWRRLKG